MSRLKARSKHPQINRTSQKSHARSYTTPGDVILGCSLACLDVAMNKAFSEAVLRQLRRSCVESQQL